MIDRVVKHVISPWCWQLIFSVSWGSFFFPPPAMSSTWSEVITSLLRSTQILDILVPCLFKTSLSGGGKRLITRSSLLLLAALYGTAHPNYLTIDTQSVIALADASLGLTSAVERGGRGGWVDGLLHGRLMNSRQSAFIEGGRWLLYRCLLSGNVALNICVESFSVPVLCV